jgi:hypothetical protein
MDRDKAIPALLETLNTSPLWAWDTNPVLWAILCDDPVIITPAIYVPDLSTLVALAGQWAQQMPADSVPMEGLVLVTEGWLPQGEGVRLEVRDAVLAEKDGTISHFRHTRNAGIEEIELDPAQPAIPSVEAMRLVAASSWRD